MKKIFWTSVFWICVVLGFVIYLRFFDNPMAMQVSTILGVEEQSLNIAEDLTNKDLLEQMKTIQLQLDTITSKIQNVNNANVSLKTDSNSIVKLYYFNQIEDKKLDMNQQLNINSILPIDRNIAPTNDVVTETINLLLQANLGSGEIAQGFVSEFPNDDFRLISSNLRNDGTLELTFNEVPGFTSGGSARVLLLRASIEKTAKQFPFVKNVKILPENIFQP